MSDKEGQFDRWECLNERALSRGLLPGQLPVRGASQEAGQGWVW